MNTVKGGDPRLPGRFMTDFTPEETFLLLGKYNSMEEMGRKKKNLRENIVQGGKNAYRMYFDLKDKCIRFSMPAGLLCINRRSSR